MRHPLNDLFPALCELTRYYVSHMPPKVIDVESPWMIAGRIINTSRSDTDHTEAEKAYVAFAAAYFLQRRRPDFTYCELPQLEKEVYSLLGEKK